MVLLPSADLVPGHPVGGSLCNECGGGSGMNHHQACNIDRSVGGPSID